MSNFYFSIVLRRLALLVLFFIPLILVLCFTKDVSAQQKNVNLYYFWGDGCPHCAQAKIYLNDFLKSNQAVTLKSYEVWNDIENANKLKEFGSFLNVEVAGVPFFVIGDQYIVGFNKSTTPDQLNKRISYCLENECIDIETRLSETQNKSGSSASVLDNDNSNPPNIPTKVDIPIFGEMQLKNMSLPILSAVLGGIDGFNPCAMWVLVFLISLLIGLKDKKRMLFLGSAFILSSAFVYFVFMSAWLNLILFIGVIFWIRVAVGLIAVLGGGYNLREFFVNKDAACKVTDDKKRKAVFSKLRELTGRKNLIVASVGIMLLAFAVNLIELVCSAGLPLVFTQTLSLSNLPKWEYYMYMGIYIFVFMLDDLIVFILAMLTLEITGISNKYSRYSHLVGGTLMIIIGILLIVKPEYLMF